MTRIFVYSIQSINIRDIQCQLMNNAMAIFKQFDHIGIVVSDLKKAMKAFTYFFGFECREKMELKEAGIRIAFYPLGLIEHREEIREIVGLINEFFGTHCASQNRHLKLRH